MQREEASGLFKIDHMFSAFYGVRSRFIIRMRKLSTSGVVDCEAGRADQLTLDAKSENIMLSRLQLCPQS